jgi:nucleotide-binding universal stress UspA family protein
MVEFDRLLCPIDFSDASLHAVEHAATLAGWYQATVVGLHVHNPVYAPIGTPGLPPDGGTVFASPAASQRVRQQLHDALAPVRSAGAPVETAIEEGSPASQILSGVARHRADLVVLGTHGASGFERLLLGSVTEKVIRKASCPVLTVPPRAQAASQLPFRRILCPIDFSASSTRALEFALSIAQEAQADLHLVHVIEWPEGRQPPPLPGFNLPEYHVYRESEALGELDKLVPASARDWCQPTLRVVHGKPYEQVVQLSASGSIDLVVIGVHGRNALDLMIFGSTTNQVIRGAACPVLTIRS